MPAFTETHVRGSSAATREPVFVDPSGRRLQRVKKIGAAVIGLMSVYVLLILLAFLGGSTVAAPTLPPKSGAMAAGPEIAPSPRPTPSPSPSSPHHEAAPTLATGTSGTSGSGQSAAVETTADPGATAATEATAGPADPRSTETVTSAEPTSPAPASAEPSPDSEPTAPGKSDTASGRSATAPGHDATDPAKPTPPARP